MQHHRYKTKTWFTVILALLAITGCAQFSLAAPITTLTISEPEFGTSTVYVNALTEFSLSVNPIDSSIWYQWDSYNYTKYTIPFYASIEMASTSGGPPGMEIELEEGLHMLHYNSTDSAGQNEVPKIKSIYLDNSAPTTTIQFTGSHFTGVSEFIKADTQISLVSIDTASDVASISYKIDSGPYITYQTPFTVTDPGQHTINYHAIDNVNNQEIDKSITLMVDSDAPSVEIIPGTPKVVISGTTYIRPTTPISLNVQDNSGIAESSYKIDTGTWTNYIASFTVPTEGQHIITGRATDRLGISSIETTLVINVDSTPPDVFMIGSNDMLIAIKEGGTITFNSSDVGVGQHTVYYRTGNASSWNEYTGPFNINEDQAIVFYASDALGNKINEQTVYVDVEEGKAWMLYLGIALIIGGLAVGTSVFLYARKIPETKVKKHEEKQVKKAKPKNIKKKRNY